MACVCVTPSWRLGGEQHPAQLPSTPTAGGDSCSQLAVPLLQLPVLVEPEDMAALQPPTCSEGSEVDLLDDISALSDPVESTDPITVCQGALNLRSHPGNLLLTLVLLL